MTRFNTQRVRLVATASAIAVACSCSAAFAEDFVVTEQSGFADAAERAEPGDRIVLADGTWEDFQIVLDVSGTKDAPITLAAQTPGAVVLSGQSSLAIGGEHLVVSGLTFADGYSPSDAVISFRSGDAVARNVQVTQTVITDYAKPDRATQDSWVVMHGLDNQVTRSAFLGKTNKGPTFIVRLDPEAGRPNQHLIEANYFGPRAPLGGNGGETLRIGVSQTSRVDSGTVVRGNLFERSSGEVEIVSIKSENNLVTENTFYEARGSVVFRHGGGNEVSRNVFLGNGVPDTGGVRVINDRQTVRDNYFEGLRGRKFLGALVVMNGVPDSPENRYHQVTDAVIETNSFVDIAHMGFGVGTDDERSAVPTASRVADNLIAPMEGADLGLFDDVSGIDFEGNVATSEAFAPIACVRAGLELTEAANGLRYPAEDVTAGAPRDLAPVARDAVGPDYFEKPPLSYGESRSVQVAASEDALREAIREAAPGTVLSVAAGEVTVAAPLALDRPLTIKGAGDGDTIFVARDGLFDLMAGAALTLEGVGLIQTSADAPVLRGRGEAYEGVYELTLRGVVATAQGTDAVAPLLAADPETFASAVEADGLTVFGWPGPVIALSGEGLDGTYLADDVIVANSAFEDVAGTLVAYGREGRDESTFGPRFTMTGSTVSGAAAGGTALALDGIDGLTLDGNRMSGSGDVMVRRRVLGMPFSIGENEVSGATQIDVTGVEGEPIDVSAQAGDAAGASSTTEPTAGPSLVLTAEGAEAIRAAGDLPPLMQDAFETAKDRVARSVAEGVIVPTPADPGGGYTHERHKENYKVIHDAGVLYALTGDASYLEHAQAMLLAYADMYPELGDHPQAKNQAPGRLFWQSLNEAMWLVYAVQGYDAIRADLDEDARQAIEAGVFRPMADFLSVGSPQTFRKIHNHGTWAAAAVGMTGYAIGDRSMVERSILGLDGDGETGFLAQLDELFSPDGYYTEGPYYQRFALLPFVLFGQAIENNEPDRAIFAHRDGVLLKAITATIQQSYGGKFFAINDAIKEKGLDTQELVYGVAAAYAVTGDAGLLSVAQGQGTTVLTGDGLAVARTVEEGQAADFDYETMVLRDGPNGEQGGLAIMRMGEGADAQTAVLKHTGMGMGHGHFDKLALTFYDAGREVVTDYGAARFLNVPSKEGGRYLPENQSFAKQTIAHNTVVVDGQSHFGGDWRRGQESAPTVTLFEDGEEVKVVRGTIADAYEGTTLTRTTLQVAREGKAPLLIDLFDVEADEASQLDLPLYFDGQLTDSSVDLARSAEGLSPLGQEAGYQHLWREASAPTDGAASFTWLTGGRFYTYHSGTTEPSEAMIVRTGANDPDFNLRSQQGVIVRMRQAEAARFVSVIEPHGLYDPSREVTVQSDTEIASVTHERGKTGSVVRVGYVDGTVLAVGIADDTSKRRHRVRMDGETYAWSGATKIFRE